jgi:hypothetical protein
MLLKFSKFLENLAFKIRQRALYFELKYYIKIGSTYIKPVNYYTRGIGKTFTLIQLAKKFKCPIAVPNHGTAKYIKGVCKEHKIKNIETFVCNDSMRGRRLELVLCEEGINYEYINEVLKPMSDCVIGFYNSMYFNNESDFKREYACDWIK